MISYKRVSSEISSFFKKSFPDTTKKEFRLWLVISLGLSFVGALVAYFSFREAFGLGDASTFFRFAHNLFSGEAIYKDFIHFRTPGSYFGEMLSIKLFGDQISSVVFAIQFESHAVFTFVFATGIALILRFKKPLVGLAVLTPIVFLPAYLQLRTGFAFLAIALYIQSKRSETYKYVWLILSGIVTGWAFIYGQEAAVIVAMTIFVAELYVLQKSKWKVQLKNLLVLAGGLLAGLSPLIIYILFASNAHNFIYYTLYYAFILQPKGMDIAYPTFAYENAIYYLVPLLVVISFYIFYSLKKASLSYVILLAFVIARFVTLFGRSDMGHLIFVLPEVILVITLALLSITKADFNRRQLLRFLPYGIALVLSFILAKAYTSGFLFVGALTVALAFKFRKTPVLITRPKTTNYIVLGIMSGAIAIFGFTLFPSIYETVSGISKRGVTSTSLGGINTDAETFDQVNAVGNAIMKHKPTTMFSYPIQAYYYTYAPKHAARFITFEPQTTLAEQDQTISDLMRTKPEVVVFDPLQAAALSKSLWKINSYIMENYKISEMVVKKEILWIMVPRQGEAKKLEYFALTLRKDNLNSTDQQGAHDIQSPEKGINNGVMQNPKSELDFRPSKASSLAALSIAVYFNELQPTASCGEVRLHYVKDTVVVPVCAKDGVVTIPVKSGLREVDLINKDSAMPVIWNEPVLSS